jgi:hypothetical protein
MIKKGFVYRGKIATDVLVYVKAVSKKTNTVVGIVTMGVRGIADATISYRYDDFLTYYEETDIAYTRVTFKLSDGEVVAFLWDVPANKGNIVSYMHVGQHSEASGEFYRDLELATEVQYESLQAELESVGYLLNVQTSSRMPTIFKYGRL